MTTRRISYSPHPEISNYRGRIRRLVPNFNVSGGVLKMILLLKVVQYWSANLNCENITHLKNINLGKLKAQSLAAIHVASVLCLAKPTVVFLTCDPQTSIIT